MRDDTESAFLQAIPMPCAGLGSPAGDSYCRAWVAPFIPPHLSVISQDSSGSKRRQKNLLRAALGLRLWPAGYSCTNLEQVSSAAGQRAPSAASARRARAARTRVRGLAAEAASRRGGRRRAAGGGAGRSAGPPALSL